MSLLETVKSSICKGKRDPRKCCAGDFLGEELSSRSLSPAALCGVWLPAGQAGGAHWHPHPSGLAGMHADRSGGMGDVREMTVLVEMEDEGTKGQGEDDVGGY